MFERDHQSHSRVLADVSNFTSGWHDQALFFWRRKHFALPVFGGWEIWMVFARLFDRGWIGEQIAGSDQRGAPGPSKVVHRHIRFVLRAVAFGLHRGARKLECAGDPAR